MGSLDVERAVIVNPHGILELRGADERVVGDITRRRTLHMNVDSGVQAKHEACVLSVEDEVAASQ